MPVVPEREKGYLSLLLGSQARLWVGKMDV